MNPEFPNASESFKKRNPHLFGDSRIGPCAVKKEQPLPADKRRLGNRQKHQGADEAAGKRYSVRVVFGMADNRKRDLDGMLATVLDAIPRAARRLLAGNTGDSSVSDQDRTA